MEQQLEFNDGDLERILSEPDLSIDLAARNNLIINDILNYSNQSQHCSEDIISQLPNEVVKYIFSKLDTNTLLIVGLVSSHFNELSNDFEIWKQKCRYNPNDDGYNYYFEKILKFHHLDDNNNNNDSMISNKRICRLYTNEITPYHIDYKSWKRLYFELGSITFNNGFDLIESAVECSSFDDNQVIEHTLACNKQFWSSKGSADPNSVDHLIYQLEQPVCLISSVQIHVFKACFQPGLPIYSPQAIRFSVGFSPHSYHYVSDLFSVKQTDEPQTFSLEPRLVVGGFIRIDLIGKHQTQTLDGLYYNVLRYVCADGLPLGSLESTPELSYSLLKFYSSFLSEQSVLTQFPQIKESDIQPDSGEDIYNSVIQQMKSSIAPKIDKKRIYNSLIQAVVKDLFEGRYESAINTIFEKGIRSPRIFNLFVQSKNPEALSRYYCTLLQRQENFSLEESLLFTRESIESGNINLFTKMFLSDKIYASDQLGEYLLHAGLPIVAAEVFSRSLIPDKVILCLFISGSHMETVHLINSIGINHQFAFSYLIEMFKTYSKYQAYLFALTVIHNLPDLFEITPQLLQHTFQLSSKDSLELQVNELNHLLSQEQDIITPLQSYKFLHSKQSQLSTFFEYFKRSNI